MKISIVTIFILLFIVSFGFCGNKAYHDVEMNVKKTAVISLSNNSEITMSIDISEAMNSGNKVYVQVSPDAIDTSKKLYYSSVVGKGMSYKIAVTGIGSVPRGTALFVDTEMLPGGSGRKGTINGEIMIISDDYGESGDLIRNIGSCTTGIDINNGVQLKYRFKVIDPNTVEANSNATCTIIYTITEQ
jgi:hypothetical protein